ncbi:YjbA family protein [Calidifontibacillus oryziterrae]|uniref:YjbA family protein n=1 Tax=Calidifontibacillus oryziterrae TaxID=1191699 RepID=UPI00031A0930|nr:YjbA family protein [Calidifontibacillus oryziterrae]
MLYLHDVWVNWFEGEENGYNVCHFHEWRKDDTVELLDQAPLIKVERPLFNYIENDLADLPQSLLKDVYQKSYIRKNHERIQQDYCFIATDGIGIIAIDTLGYHLPIRKSRLIPRQEQLVYDMAEGIEATTYDFESPTNKEYHILSPDPLVMKGLTRKERQLKQLLFMTLDQLQTTGNPAEIRYWYTEWNPAKYQETQKQDFEYVWKQLYEETMYGWSPRHENLCERLVKGHPFFEKLWELEHGTRVN